MASPSLVSSTVTSITTSATAHTYNLPATVAAGDLMVAWLVAGDSTLTAGTTLTDDWTNILDRLVIAFHRWQCWVRRADGTEGGSTIAATAGSAVKGGGVVQRISGAWGSGGEGTAYEIGTPTSTGFGTGPNPNSVTAPWGSADQLYIAAATGGGDGATFTAPSGYGSLAQVAAGAGHIVAAAVLAETSASDDPAAFSLDLSENHQAVTLVIRPLDVSADLDMSVAVAAAGVPSLEGAAALSMSTAVAASGKPGSIGSVDPMAITLAVTGAGVLAAGGSASMAMAVSAGSGFARTRGIEWLAAGEQALLDGTWDTSTPSTLRLFTNDPSAVVTEAAANQLTETDFTEAAFNGYTAVALTSGNWTVTEGDPTDATHTTATFTVGADLSPAVEIVGYYVTRDSDGSAMYFDVLADGPHQLEKNGDALSLDPKVTLQ
jgi:hypothetical protein